MKKTLIEVFDACSMNICTRNWCFDVDFWILCLLAYAHVLCTASTSTCICGIIPSTLQCIAVAAIRAGYTFICGIFITAFRLSIRTLFGVDFIVKIKQYMLLSFRLNYVDSQPTTTYDMLIYVLVAICATVHIALYKMACICFPRWHKWFARHQIMFSYKMFFIHWWCWWRERAQNM